MGLEQFSLVHDQGSSHGATRIIRLAYFEHPNYVPLLRRAYELWYQLEQQFGEQLLTECGLLNIGLPSSEIIDGVRQSVLDHALDVTEYSAPELVRLWPQFRLPDDYVGIFEKQAGYLRVERCVQAHLTIARQHGATIQASEPVLSWRRVGQAYEVTTTRGTYHTAKLVITAGAWTAAIMQSVWKLPLTVMRQTAHWFHPVDTARVTRQRLPCYLIDTPAGEFYGFPQIDQQGLKVARHYGAVELPSPEIVDRQLHSTDRTPIEEFTRTYLPGIMRDWHTGSVCLYTLTPDRHFLIDSLPDDPNVVIAAVFRVMALSLPV